MQLFSQKCKQNGNDENVNWNCQRHYKHSKMKQGKVVFSSGMCVSARGALRHVMRREHFSMRVHVEIPMRKACHEESAEIYPRNISRLEMNVVCCL